MTATAKPSPVQTTVPLIVVLTMMQAVLAFGSTFFFFGNSIIHGGGTFPISSIEDITNPQMIVLTSFLIYDPIFAIASVIIGGYCVSLKNKQAFRRNKKFQLVSLVIAAVIAISIIVSAYYFGTVTLEISDVVWMLVFLKSHVVLLSPIVLFLLHRPQVKAHYLDSY